MPQLNWFCRQRMLTVQRIGLPFAICLFALGCSFSGIGSRSDSTLQSKVKSPDTHFNCAFGNPFVEGRTVMQLRESGAVKVSFSKGEQPDAYEGQLAEQANQSLWQQIEGAAVCSMKRNRAGLPEEQIIQFELFRKGKICQGEAWRNEQESNPALQSLMVALAEMANEISGGKIPNH